MLVRTGTTTRLLARATSGERLYAADLLRLAREASLAELSRAAAAVRTQRLPGTMVTYRRCSGAVLHPTPAPATLASTLDMLHWLQAHSPALSDHWLEPSTVLHLARTHHLPTRTILEQLYHAGLTLLDGADTHLLVPAACTQVAYTEQHGIALSGRAAWLRVMREAQKVGLQTSAAAVVGAGSSDEAFIRHLQRVRDVQDYALRSHGNGFVAFQTIHALHAHPLATPDTERQASDERTHTAYVRAVALARLFLDNITHHQVAYQPGTAAAHVQQALQAGADDLGRVAAEAVAEQQAQQCIVDAGYAPVRRDSAYNTANSFDMLVELPLAWSLARSLTQRQGRAMQPTRTTMVPMPACLN